jgi:hypothetical protein
MKLKQKVSDEELARMLAHFKQIACYDDPTIAALEELRELRSQSTWIAELKEAAGFMAGEFARFVHAESEETWNGLTEGAGKIDELLRKLAAPQEGTK